MGNVFPEFGMKVAEFGMSGSKLQMMKIIFFLTSIFELIQYGSNTKIVLLLWNKTRFLLEQQSQQELDKLFPVSCFFIERI